MYWMGTCLVLYPFPCDVLVMSWLGTLVLAPSVNSLSRGFRAMENPLSAIMGTGNLFFVDDDDYELWFALLACALHTMAGELDATRPSGLRCEELWGANPTVRLGNTPTSQLHDVVKAAQSSKSVLFTWADCEAHPICFCSRS